MKKIIYPLLTVFTFCSLNLPVFAENNVKIVTWNIHEIFSVDDAKKREPDFKKFSNDIKPDVIMLEEVTSLEEVEQIKKEMGLDDYYTVCTDFQANDSNKHGSFEVAVISKYKISEATEYDSTPGDNKPNYTQQEKKLVSPIFYRGKEISRGFLWVKLDDIKLTLSVVHLKSSRGKKGRKDQENAEEREYVAGAVAENVAKNKQKYPDFYHIVAGDFNIGHSDFLKNGKNLKKDCYNGKKCGDSDKYDETHSIFSEGLINDLRMKNLTFHINKSTFPSFPGTPIDNIYVTGPDENKFTPCKTGFPDTYGSDHVPVFTTFTP